MVVGHGDSPVGHAARRVFLCDDSECVVRLLVPKRMEHRYGAAELRLNRWVAGNGEIHLAEFSRVARGMLMLGNDWYHERGPHPHEQHNRNEVESLHHAGLLIAYRSFGMETLTGTGMNLVDQIRSRPTRSQVGHEGVRPAGE